MPPGTTPTAEIVWLGPFEGTDLIAASEKPDSTIAEAIKGRLTQNCSQRRRGAALELLGGGSDLSPTLGISWRGQEGGKICKTLPLLFVSSGAAAIALWAAGSVMIKDYPFGALPVSG